MSQLLFWKSRKQTKCHYLNWKKLLFTVSNVFSLSDWWHETNITCCNFRLGEIMDFDPVLQLQISWYSKNNNEFDCTAEKRDTIRFGHKTVIRTSFCDLLRLELIFILQFVSILKISNIQNLDFRNSSNYSDYSIHSVNYIKNKLKIIYNTKIKLKKLYNIIIKQQIITNKLTSKF